MAPKLSDAHVYPTNFQKMKVKYATQVLSATVAASLNAYIGRELPSEAIFTVEFIDKMDKLFDLFNSSKFGASKRFNKPFMGRSIKLIF